MFLGLSGAGGSLPYPFISSNSYFIYSKCKVFLFQILLAREEPISREILQKCRLLKWVPRALSGLLSPSLPHSCAVSIPAFGPLWVRFRCLLSILRSVELFLQGALPDYSNWAWSPTRCCSSEPNLHNSTQRDVMGCGFCVCMSWRAALSLVTSSPLGAELGWAPIGAEQQPAQADCSILNEEPFNFPSEAPLGGCTKGAQWAHQRREPPENKHQASYYYFLCC